MASFNEMSPRSQFLIIVAMAIALVFAVEYAVLDSQRTDNAQAEQRLQDLESKNAQLRPYLKKLSDLKKENASLQQQLKTLQTIVPEQMATDDFIREMQSAARQSYVSIRRITAKPLTKREFYVETPYELQLDGTYMELMSFYDRLARMQRIVNVSDLGLTGISKLPGGAPSGGGIVGNYTYRPNETVTAVCTVTTFYSEGQVATVAPVKK